MMTREQAEIILDKMSLDECIKMWNDEGGADMYCRCMEIHEVDDDEWWEYLHKELGARHIAEKLFESRADEKFSHYDRYYLYIEDDCTFYSFDSKKDLVKILGEWFIEELINR